MTNFRIRNAGPFLIMAAAALWALDALIRTGLTKTIPPASIVFFEHLLGFIVLLPVFVRAIPVYRSLKVRDWVVLIFLTLVSSVLGTLLFTEALSRSFASYDFATPLLLQKLQPIFVIALSALFLRERLTARFLILVPIALIGSYLISFGSELVSPNFSEKMLVVVLALGASLAWGVGTILSKHMLTKLDYAPASAMRFFLAIPVSYVAVLILGDQYPVTALALGDIARFFAIALSTGAVAILIYYRGLAKTEAKVSTIAELSFPIVSIVIAVTSLNPYGAPQILSWSNITGIVLLLGAILAISFDYSRERPLEVAVPASRVPIEVA